MKDDQEKIVLEEVLDPKFMAKNYEVLVNQQLDELDRRNTQLEFRNSKKQLMMIKDFNLYEPEFEENEYDEVKENFDDKGERKSSVYIKKFSNNSQLVTHKLKPTLIGAQYYYAIVDEVLEDETPVKRNLTIVSERGKIIAQK